MYILKFIQVELDVLNFFRWKGIFLRFSNTVGLIESLLCQCIDLFKILDES